MALTYNAPRRNPAPSLREALWPTLAVVFMAGLGGWSGGVAVTSVILLGGLLWLLVQLARCVERLVEEASSMRVLFEAVIKDWESEDVSLGDIARVRKALRIHTAPE